MNTGLPWEYFQRQTDEVIATYLDILKSAHGKRSGSTMAESAAGNRDQRGRVMGG